MFISRNEVKEIKRRLKQLECNHDKVYYNLSGVDFLHYRKICKNCGKYLGTFTYKQKLQEEKKQLQNQLKTKNKELKEGQWN